MLILIQHKCKLGAIGYYEFDYRDVRQTVSLWIIMIGLHGF